MFFIYLFNFFRGYVIIKAEGNFLERFINICTNRQVLLWDIKKKGANCLTASVSPDGFRALRESARKTHTRIGIIKKKGMPFKTHRFLRRKSLALGLLLFAGCAIWFSLHIWSVEIDGAYLISEDLIKQELQNSGLKPGVYTSSVERQKIQQEMLSKIDKLSWLWVDIRGVKAIVRIKEKLPMPTMVSTAPCHVVATEGGIITRMVVKEGKPNVKVGYSVAKDQVLISGELESTVMERRYVAAAGEVMAKVAKETSGVYCLVGVRRSPTGRKSTKCTVMIHNINIPLFIKYSPGYAGYTCDFTVKELNIGVIKLPVRIRFAKYSEMMIDSVMYTFEDLKQDIEKEIVEKIKSRYTQVNILQVSSEPSPVDDTNIKVKVKVQWLMDIAKQMRIEPQ